MRTSLLVKITSVVATAALLASCSSSKKSEGSAGTYGIGVVLDQTGVSSQLSIPLGAGIDAYFKHVNDAGGVNGRKIEVIKTSNGQSTAAGAQAAAQEVVQAKPLAVIGSVTTLGISSIVPVMDTANTAAMLAFAPDSLLQPVKPWLFTQVMPAASQLTASLSYLAKTMGDLKGKRLAVSAAASSFGDAYVAAFQAQSGQMGYDVALVDRSPVTMTSFATNAAKVVSSRADALLLLDVPSQTSLIMKDLVAAGFKGPVVGYESASDPKIFQAVASTQYVSFRGAPIPASTGLLHDAAQAAGVADHLNSLWFTYGWNEAAILTDALSRCGASCTNTQLLSALSATSGFTPPGDTTFGPVSYSASKHYATTSVQFFSWSDGDKAERPTLSPISPAQP